jgi:hypothetical protein
LIWVYGFARGLETSSSGGAGGEASRSSSRRGASLFASETPRRGGIDWNGFQVRHPGSGRAYAAQPVAASGANPRELRPRGPARRNVFRIKVQLSYPQGCRAGR